MDKTDLPVWVNSSQLKLKAISDETRRVILGLLEADGPQFQIELAKKLKISASLATYHLNLLVRASLVKREYTERRTGGFSKYTITQEGSNFLDSLGIRQ